MAEAQSTTISTEGKRPGLLASRQFTGTSFLTLEHVGYFALVVLVPAVLAMGALTAIGLWSHSSGSEVQPGLVGGTPTAVETAAALAVLTPLLYLLRSRTAAEYDKRTGYRNRVGYKLPVYTALAVLAAATVGSFISMLAVFLNSLAQIGVQGADIGQLYTSEFIPASLLFVVFGLAVWYVLWLAKGRDASKSFIGLTS